MKSTADRRIKAGYITALVLILFSYSLIFYTTKRIDRQTLLIVHTNIVISNIEQLLSNIKDGETGLRGYLMVKNPTFLEPYNKSLITVPASIKKLESYVNDNPYQVRNLNKLKILIDEKYFLMDSTKRTFDANNHVLPAYMFTMAYKGKNVMDKIRSLTNEMKGIEVSLLKRRSKEMQSFQTAINTINISSLVIALLLAFYSLTNYTRENKLKRKYRYELENRIYDLNRLNEELVELKSNEKFAATGRMARAIAHEVRNPLTNIVLASEQLKEYVQDNEESALFLSMIKRNGERINKLISDLLQATKLIDLKVEKWCINTLLDEALVMAEDRIKLQDLIVQKHYLPNGCNIMVDGNKVRIALLNVIVNAIEAMTPGKGVLTLITKKEKEKCVIEIIDNGVGIDNDSLTKLYEPYFTNKENGNGLGLTNTKNIVLNHKGSIDVKSSLGHGTTFTISLDVA